MKNLLKEPLLHFLLAGSLLFGLSFLFGKTDIRKASVKEKIIIDSSVVKNILLQYQHNNDTTAPPARTEQLIENYIQDEMLYREALKIGLDKRDDNVRTILVNQMKAVYAPSEEIAKPSEDTLSAFYKTHPREFAYLASRDGTLPPYSQVRDIVETDYKHRQQEQLDKVKMEALRKEYEVIRKL